jgi:anti-sigma B factor antagonist
VRASGHDQLHLTDGIPVPNVVQTKGNEASKESPIVGGRSRTGDNPHVADSPFRVERIGDRTVRLIGELDLASFETALAELEPLIAEGGDLELDLEGLTFLDSSGIRVLIKCRTGLEGRGRLRLRGASPHVAKILEIAGLRDIGVRMEDRSSDG